VKFANDALEHGRDTCGKGFRMAPGRSVITVVIVGSRSGAKPADRQLRIASDLLQKGQPAWQ